MAVGLSDGSIILHNLLVDKKLFQLQQIGRVTSLSFRTDDVTHMASSNGSGQIFIWNLEEKSLLFSLEAHASSISSIQYLNGTPLLVSTGGDNCIKVFSNLSHSVFYALCGDFALLNCTGVDF